MKDVIYALKVSKVPTFVRSGLQVTPFRREYYYGVPGYKNLMFVLPSREGERDHDVEGYLTFVENTENLRIM
ncbi:MAG: hypothetical protein NT141_00280 [candidate division WWE3 bacterium]|nr:hypothetical protein [candidate division WWE3 bacterium]